MYAIVDTAGNEEKVVEKLGTPEDAYRAVLELLELADEDQGLAAAASLFMTLRVETLH